MDEIVEIIVTSLYSHDQIALHNNSGGNKGTTFVCKRPRFNELLLAAIILGTWRFMTNSQLGFSCAVKILLLYCFWHMNLKSVDVNWEDLSWSVDSNGKNTSRNEPQNFELEWNNSGNQFSKSRKLEYYAHSWTTRPPVKEPPGLL